VYQQELMTTNDHNVLLVVAHDKSIFKRHDTLSPNLKIKTKKLKPPFLLSVNGEATSLSEFIYVIRDI